MSRDEEGWNRSAKPLAGFASYDAWLARRTSERENTDSAVLAGPAPVPPAGRATRAKHHRMRGILGHPKDWPSVHIAIDCPWAVDDPDRDCQMADETGTPLTGCVLQDWLDARGAEAIGLVSMSTLLPIELPVFGYCGWGAGGVPTFVADGSHKPEGGDNG